MRLEGRTALVTGGASGIGAAVCRRLHAEGASVVVADIDLEGAQHVAADVGGSAIEMDVTDVGSVDGAVAGAGELAGPLDVLVNNAGTDEFAFFAATEPALWDRVLAVNLRGVLAVTHAVLPEMIERRRGRIVNVASEAGRVGSSGSAAYSAAKAGVIGFTKALARETARFGITVNAVAPGPIDTPLLRRAEAELPKVGKKLVETMVGATALRRLGSADEVAAAIAFLASDDSSYVTGQTLGVSGGLAMV